MSPDYRDTVFLPRTDFAMKANLPEREPRLIERWRGMDLYWRLREDSKGREKFVLHDGPPYANGNIHIGHAVNKILKDVINRSKQMLGFDAPYVPGWDCHGLPIEWKVEEGYRKRGLNKDEVPVLQFRKECREFAGRWLDVQRDEFQRLGVVGDWADPYVTMAVEAEALIVRELHKFLLSGLLYRGKKSVMWSPVEKTALAEAEVEYHDHKSTTVWVRFPFTKAPDPDLEGASILIWTTTPWTIPGNRATAYNGDIDYVLVEIEDPGEGSLAKAGERLVLAEMLLPEVMAAGRVAGHRVLKRFKGKALEGGRVAHPLGSFGPFYRFDVPLLDAAYVTTEQGTGIVHIAPAHGPEDFDLCMRVGGIEVPDAVAEDGTYTAEAPGFEGVHVFRAAAPVIEALTGCGTLFAYGTLTHSYPHSWRSKAPVIFRATAQWFIGMDRPVGRGGMDRPFDGNGGGDARDTLRARALDAIDATRFVPKRGQNRLRAMIEGRPDWNVSRQRAWGVPLAVFLHKASGEALRDPEVCARIEAAFREEGADAWWSRDPQEFLGNAYRAEDFERIDDILDVWFESGSTHAFVLERRPELKWPADLYLEGSDQHRGWFHSSLLESCGTRGRAPFEAVLTHGFTLDERGEKMAKSKGNGVAPQDVMRQYGADILRLWAVTVDTSDDHRIGPEILKGQADAYRRLRNTLRYVLGNLAGFDGGERLPEAEMPELERWVLHRLWELDGLVRSCNEAFDYPRLYGALHNFCATDLSAFYFDVRKDSLYCDRPDSVRRRAARTVLDRLFHCLVRWLAPVLCFTAEEAWLTRHPGEAGSVHLETFPAVPEAWRDDGLAAKWERVRAVRRAVTGALEVERREKRIGASLQAAPVVHVEEDDLRLLAGIDLAELAITSGVETTAAPPPDGAFRLPDVPGVAVVPRLALGLKCARCWQVRGDVDPATLLEPRCAEAVRATPARVEA